MSEAISLTPFFDYAPNHYVDGDNRVYVKSSAGFAYLTTLVECEKKSSLLQQKLDKPTSISPENSGGEGITPVSLVDPKLDTYPNPEKEFLEMRKRTNIPFQWNTNFPSDQKVRDWIKEHEELFGYDQNTKLTIIAFYNWIKSL